MKASDLLCKILKEFGVEKVFGVTGGSILHPLQSAHDQGLEVIYTHHEQAASFAADAATRISNQPQACFITTGPAGTNAMTGVLTSWLDSIPQIIISGQARLDDLTDDNSVRQIGTQHYNVIGSIRNMTNASIQLKSKKTFCEDIVNTLMQSIRSRPGPVWIDIPLDLQWAEIEDTHFNICNARSFKSELSFQKNIELPNKDLENRDKLEKCLDKLVKAERPLAIIGAGCKSGSIGQKLITALRIHAIPMVFTWGSVDLLKSEDDLNLGLIGINGQRSANMAAFKADIVAGFGTHLSDQITGRDKKSFAPNAYRFIIDIDKKECERVKDYATTISVDIRDHIGWVKDYLEKSEKVRILNRKNLKLLKSLRGYDESTEKIVDSVNIMRFYSMLFKCSNEKNIFVADGGGNTFFSSLQNIRIKKGQKAITSGGSGCMGSGLPQAIGAAIASSGRVICFIGDGSMQFNIQELQTIKHHQLNVTVIIVNNSGYQAIMDTQNSFFDGNKFGVDKDSGLSLPDYKKVVEAYGIEYKKYESDYGLGELEFKNICQESGAPIVIEIIVKQDTPMYPKLSSGRVVDNDQIKIPGIASMDPQIKDEELKEILAVESW